MGSFARNLGRRLRAAPISPVSTNHPDKGKRDGRCNRTACQEPLAGSPRWSMLDYQTGGRLYYCRRCVMLFNECDDRMREERRCSIVEGDE